MDFTAPINYDTEANRVLDFTDIDDGNQAVFYRTIDGDVVDTLAEAIVMGYDDTKVIVSGFFVGSLDDMRASAKAKCDEFLRYC